MNENHIPAYNEQDCSGLVRHILIRYGFTTKEIMVCFVINGDNLPCADKFVDKLSQIEGMRSITFSKNKEKYKCHYGKRDRSTLGRWLHYRLHWKCKISDFSAVVLSGESGTDRKAL